jgi:hypothetical protein
VQAVDNEESKGPYQIACYKKVKRCHKQAKIDDAFEITAKIKVMDSNNAKNSRKRNGY